MQYGELIQLYFERTNALQSLWILYVVILGGLLAFSSLRQRPDLVTTALVTVLFGIFAFRNLGGIRDATFQRFAVLKAIQQAEPAPGAGDAAGGSKALRATLEPTLAPPTYGEVRNFHVFSDLLTVAALWAMELRRRRQHAGVLSEHAGRPTPLV